MHCHHNDYFAVLCCAAILMLAWRTAGQCMMWFYHLQFMLLHAAIVCCTLLLCQPGRLGLCAVRVCSTAVLGLLACW
jgi:hypothetical protein